METKEVSTSEKYADKIIEVAYYNFPMVYPKETVRKASKSLLAEYLDLHLQKFADIIKNKATIDIEGDLEKVTLNKDSIDRLLTEYIEKLK